MMQLTGNCLVLQLSSQREVEGDLEGAQPGSQTLIDSCTFCRGMNRQHLRWVCFPVLFH